MRKWKKETLAKNILSRAYFWQLPIQSRYDPKWLDERFKGTIDWYRNEIEKNKEELIMYQTVVRAWEALYGEYLKDKNEFVKKYYKITRNSLLRQARKYNMYRDLIILLDKFVQK